MIVLKAAYTYVVIYLSAAANVPFLALILAHHLVYDAFAQTSAKCKHGFAYANNVLLLYCVGIMLNAS